jgi:SAM-dependent methyltransferase
VEPADLASHPDRLRWNARYGSGPADRAARFEPHPLARRALALPPPAGCALGPVLDLACGPSGTALAAAAAGRPVTAVDVSDVALDLLASEAARRGLGDLITLVQADITAWCPEPAGFALVLCTGYWDRAALPGAVAAVAPGGLLGWEALTEQARAARPALPAAWCLGPGEPAALLPPDFTVLDQADHPGGLPRRSMLARRAEPAGAAG